MISKTHAHERALVRCIWEDECFIHQGPLSGGYARVHRNGKHEWAHRVVWEAYNGPLTDDLSVHHTCHNRSCLNPEHLQAISKVEHGRAHAADGHKVQWGYEGPNTPCRKCGCKDFSIRADRGTRRCNPCHRAEARLQKVRRKQRAAKV